MEKWETEKDKRIITKAFFKTNRTFISLAVKQNKNMTSLLDWGKRHCLY